MLMITSSAAPDPALLPHSPGFPRTRIRLRVRTFRSVIGGQSQFQTVPPRDSDRLVKQSGGEEDGQVGTAVKADLDFAIRYGNVGRNVDQIAKDLTGLSIGIAAHCFGENTIDPTGENQKDHVEIDLESDGGRERI